MRAIARAMTMYSTRALCRQRRPCGGADVEGSRGEDGRASSSSSPSTLRASPSCPRHQQRMTSPGFNRQSLDVWEARLCAVEGPGALLVDYDKSTAISAVSRLTLQQSHSCRAVAGIAGRRGYVGNIGLKMSDRIGRFKTHLE